MEITANAVQTVAANSNVVFTETAVSGNCSIMHREGSGLVTLRGLTNQRRARFRVSFGANIAVPSTGTAAAIQVAIAVNGEPISATTMIATPAAVSEYHNVSRTLYLDVPAGCCSQVSIENTGTAALEVQNASLIIERVA